MQREQEEFEKMLAQLQPARPSMGLRERLRESIEAEETAVAKPSGTRGGKNVIWGVSFTLVSAMAAVWAVLLVLSHRSEPSRIAGDGNALGGQIASSEEPLFKVNARPIEQYATLMNAEPSPVYFLEDGSPVQNISLRYLDTEVWAMEGSEETFTVSTLRDEVRVVPAPTF